MDLQTAFQILGINYMTDAYAQKKRKYKEAVKKFHPDGHPDEKAYYTMKLQEINQAWAVVEKNTIPDDDMKSSKKNKWEGWKEKVEQKMKQAAPDHSDPKDLLKVGMDAFLDDAQMPMNAFNSDVAAFIIKLSKKLTER